MFVAYDGHSTAATIALAAVGRCDRMSCAELVRLQRRTDEQLVDRHPGGLRHGVEDARSDVLGPQGVVVVVRLAAALADRLVADVVRELGANGTRLDQRHPN